MVRGNETLTKRKKEARKNDEVNRSDEDWKLQGDEGLNLN